MHGRRVSLSCIENAKHALSECIAKQNKTSTEKGRSSDQGIHLMMGRLGTLQPSPPFICTMQPIHLSFMCAKRTTNLYWDGLVG